MQTVFVLFTLRQLFSFVHMASSVQSSVVLSILLHSSSPAAAQEAADNRPAEGGGDHHDNQKDKQEARNDFRAVILEPVQVM